MVKATQGRPVTAEDFVTLANLADKVQQLGKLLDQPFAFSTGISDQAKLESLVQERSDLIGQVQTLQDDIANEVEAVEKEYRGIWQQESFSDENRDRTLVGLWAELLQVPLTGSRGAVGRNAQRATQ